MSRSANFAGVCARLFSHRLILLMVASSAAGVATGAAAIPTLDRAKQAFAAGQYAEAAQLFEKANREAPQCDTLFYLGLTRYRLKQLDPALIAFQSAIQCDPKLTSAQVALAEAYAEKGNWAKALKAYLRVLSLEPANVPALRGAASIYLRNEENDKALALLETLVAADRTDAQAHADLGAAYAATGNRDAARLQFKETLRMKASDASALTGLANLYLKDGDEAQGISLLEKAIKSAPNAFEPHFLLGSAYSRLNRYEDARHELENALRLGGEQSEIYYQLARVYGALGRQDDRRQALAHFAELARKAKDDEESERAVAKLMPQVKALIDSGELNTAVPLMEKARQLRPSDDKVLFRLAGLEYDLQHYDLARNYAQEAISIAPSEWLYHFLLGLVEKDSGRLKEAQTSFETAVRLNPSAAPVHNALGEVELQKNEPQRALADFQRAVELDPRQLTYRSNLDAARAAGETGKR